MSSYNMYVSLISKQVLFIFHLFIYLFIYFTQFLSLIYLTIHCLILSRSFRIEFPELWFYLSIYLYII